jgi:DNA-3-methyladenine glycosylase
MTRLPRRFFARDPRVVARELLGKVLVRRLADGRRLTGRIVETEAYLGRGDRAAHAATGMTARNAVLFGPPGHAYVYFTYGLHHCMNVSCQPEGEAGCVLLRALQPLEGKSIMARRRGRLRERLLTSGPARLCQAFAITRKNDNGKDLCAAASDLYFASDGTPPGRIQITPRIGIRRSPERLLRFCRDGDSFLSR